MKLDTQINRRIKKYGPKGGLDHTAQTVMALSGVNHQSVKEHNERVALLAEATAIELGKDAKAAFFAGLLHDTGKVTQPHNLFDGHNITAEEYAQVKEHAKDGYQVLAGRHLFTALCAGMHHAMYFHGYGITVSRMPKKWHMGTVKKALEIAGVISICDFVDAFSQRKTTIKDGSDQGGQDLRSMLYSKYPEDHQVIEIVLKKNIQFGFVKAA